MSDYIAFEIQVEIMERLPVKSLIQFRTVSKAWKSLIDSSEFIASHSVHHSQPQRLLVSYHDRVAFNTSKYVSFVDDETFPQQKIAPTVPLFVQKLQNPGIVDSCQGLLCLYGYYEEPDDITEIYMAVLWNPSIRKSIAVAVPKILGQPHQASLGFGVLPGTSEPKIMHLCRGFKVGRFPSTPWQVKVFTLSSGVWRSISSHVLHESIDFRMSQAVIDRFLYWSAYDRMATDDGFLDYKMIMSFDLINDEFRVVYLPVSLALNPATTLSIFKLKESLAVIEVSGNIGLQCYAVWMMERAGEPLSFKKMYTINTPYASSINNVLGFRKTGEPLVVVKNDHEIFHQPEGLAVYHPYREHVDHTGICGTAFSFPVKSFVETLLLLNAPVYYNYIGIDEVEDDDFLRRMSLS